MAPRRAADAAATRQRIVDAARELFAERGWAGTAVAEVAARARVSLDTVYAAVGRKPVLVLAVVDDVLGEGRGPVPAGRRSYVEAVRAAVAVEAKIETYAAALGRLMPVVAPLLLTLRDAGATDAACARAWSTITERRARNMIEFAADLRSTGRLRADLSDQDVADLVWSTNSPEYFTLLTTRGWTAERYADHLTDLWTRLLLDR